MPRQPRPHGFAGLCVGGGRFKGHGTYCGKPAKAAACVKSGQKFVAPVALKNYLHGAPLPLRMQGAGQPGQQIGLGVVRVLKPEPFKQNSSTDALDGFVPPLGQPGEQGLRRRCAGCKPEGALFFGGENPGCAQALNLAGAQGKPVGFALQIACAAVMDKFLPQCFERQRVQRKMVTRQHQKPPVPLPCKHSPQGAAVLRVQPGDNQGHDLAHQGCLLHRLSVFAALQADGLRLGKHRCVVWRKSHAQSFVACGQAGEPCLNARCRHPGSYFQRQQHKKLPPVQGMRRCKMPGKGQQGHPLARGNRRVIHILGWH